MASPVPAAVTEGAVSTAGTSHAVTLPAGGAASDEYIIIMDIGSTAATLNALANWTELLDENLANGLKILVYDGTGVPADPTFTSSAATRSAWIAYRITGADKTITPQIGVTSTGTSATPDPPASATPPSTKDYLAIAFAGMAGEEADDDTWGNTSPTNYTPSPPRQKACGIAGTNLGGLILSAERQLTTGVAENPGTFGVDVSAAWRAQTILVHPVVLTHTTTTWASSYVARAKTQRTWTSSYVVNDHVTTTWQSRYGINAHATTTWASRYVVRTHVATTWQSRYVTLAKGLTTWSSRYIAFDHVTTTWNSRYVARARITTTWQSRYVVRAHVQTTWSSRYVTGDHVTTTWASQYKVQALITWQSRYIVRDHVTTTWSSNYSVAGAAVHITRNWASRYVVQHRSTPTWTSQYTTRRHATTQWSSGYGTFARALRTWPSSYATRTRVTVSWASTYGSSTHVTTLWSSQYATSDHQTITWNSQYSISAPGRLTLTLREGVQVNLWVRHEVATDLRLRHVVEDSDVEEQIMNLDQTLEEL